MRARILAHMRALAAAGWNAAAPWTLARDLGIPERSAAACLMALEREGAVERRATGGRRGPEVWSSAWVLPEEAA